MKVEYVTAINFAYNGQVETSEISPLYAKSVIYKIDLMLTYKSGLKISSVIRTCPLNLSWLYARFIVNTNRYAITVDVS